jgi:hypothetical protein
MTPFPNANLVSIPLIFISPPKGPPQGERAHRAGGVRRADQEQHGVEQPCACLQDPVMVNSVGLKKPERIEAMGGIFLLALL